MRGCLPKTPRQAVMLGSPLYNESGGASWKEHGEALPSTATPVGGGKWLDFPHFLVQRKKAFSTPQLGRQDL